ncbi:MAG: hypothetical protein F6K35_50745 [Okeania sp. SIO2H7]|nr:hypothetical protein [Okeania sp. SIO2H7]
MDQLQQHKQGHINKKGGDRVFSIKDAIALSLCYCPIESILRVKGMAP